MLKIIIPSKGRGGTMKTHQYLQGLDYSIVLHDRDEAYFQNPTIDPSKIIVSGAPYGISYIRQWIQDNLLEKDEWYISLDDNIKGFSGVRMPEYLEKELDVENKKKDWGEIYGHDFTPHEFMDVCEEMIELAERMGAYNLGFATTDNFFFRAKKYREVAMIVSKACIRKNVGIEFDHRFNAIDDYAYTGECLLRFGRVLRNDFVFPVAGHYEEGGIGTYDKRAKMKVEEAKILMEKYPGLFRYNNKRKGVANAEVLLNFHEPEKFGAWRRWRNQQK